MVTGPFEENSFANQNVLLIMEACGTGTFAYVVFIKILPKQFSFSLFTSKAAIFTFPFWNCMIQSLRAVWKLEKIEFNRTDVCLNLLLMVVGFIITVGLQLFNQLGKFSSKFLSIELYRPYHMAHMIWCLSEWELKLIIKLIGKRYSAFEVKMPLHSPFYQRIWNKK